MYPDLTWVLTETQKYRLLHEAKENLQHKLLGAVLRRIADQPKLGNWGDQEPNLVRIRHITQAEPTMALLDN